HLGPATDRRQSPPGWSSRILLAIRDAGLNPPARMIARRPGTHLTAEGSHALLHADQASAACPSARRLTGRMTGLGLRHRMDGIVLDRDQHGTARRADLHRHPAAI